VRWTEQRNFEAVLDMMTDGRVDVKQLVSHRFEIADAPAAYELVSGSQPSLGILLKYAGAEPTIASRTEALPKATETRRIAGTPAVSLVGSGNYASAILIPAFRDTGARLRTVASRAGVTGLHAGRKFGFEETTTDLGRVFADTEVDAIVIATRHDTHADLTCQALRAGKHVYVEKPLALTLAELEAIQSTLREASSGGKSPVLTVGFNRRMSPHIRKLKELLAPVAEPKSFVFTVNAGTIPPEHWAQQAAGGGRIIGEACHFIDLLRHLAGAPIESFDIRHMKSSTGDTATITLGFADGSLGSIHYFANGSKAFPKERLEVFARSAVIQLDNFRVMRGFGWPGFNKQKLWRQDKGQKEFARAFLSALQGGPVPIPYDELMEVARITIQLGD
jgi:predicted dehydrogenase